MLNISSSRFFSKSAGMKPRLDASVKAYRRPIMHRTVLLAFVGCCTLCVALPASPASAQCGGPRRHFQIHTASLVDAFSDTIPGITEDDVEYWVVYATQQLVAQSNADIEFIYDGRTTAWPACQGVGTPDGISQVGARDISAVGATNGEDICLDSSRNWSISEYIPPDQFYWDAISLLMHEFMHWIGITDDTTACYEGVGCDYQGHAHDTTLDDSAVQGTITLRTLTGVDISRLNYFSNRQNPECQKPHANLEFARSNGGVFVPSGVGLGVPMKSGPGAAMGYTSSGDRIVVASRAFDNSDQQFPNGMRFTRAYYSSGLDETDDFDTFIYSTADFETYSAPAVAGRTSAPETWVAAWPGRRERNYTCGGIRIVVSDNGFSSVNHQKTLAFDCTAQQVALDWDPRSGRFILLYVYQSPLYQHHLDDPGDPFNSVIVARTSTDGITWSPLQVLAKSLATPGLACGPTTCILTFTTTLLGNRLPTHFSLTFDVDAGTGALVNFDNGSTDFVVQASKVDAAISSGPNYWLAHWGPYPWFSSTAAFAFTHSSNDVPEIFGYYYRLMPYPEWDVVRFPVEIAASPGRDTAYLFYGK